MAAEVTCQLPISSVKVSPNMSPIQAFTFTSLCVALKDMNPLAGASNIVDGWDRVEESIEWGIAVL
jgi:hypothetical protein